MHTNILLHLINLVHGRVNVCTYMYAYTFNEVVQISQLASWNEVILAISSLNNIASSVFSGNGAEV